MGFYNVVKPCMVGKLHHVRPTTAPIEVDDETAAPLVESGCLEPYHPGARVSGETGTVLDGSLLGAVIEESGDDVTVVPTLGMEEGGREAARSFAKAVDEAVAAESPRRPRGRRRSEG